LRQRTAFGALVQHPCLVTGKPQLHAQARRRAGAQLSTPGLLISARPYTLNPTSETVSNEERRCAAYPPRDHGRVRYHDLPRSRQRRGAVLPHPLRLSATPKPSQPGAAPTRSARCKATATQHGDRGPLQPAPHHHAGGVAGGGGVRERVAAAAGALAGGR